MGRLSTLSRPAGPVDVFRSLTIGDPGLVGAPVQIAVAERAGEMVPVHMKLLDGQAIIGGLTGAGKSNAARQIIRELAARPHTALFLCDPKMNEFGPGQPRASCLALGAKATRRVIEWGVAEAERRYEQIVDVVNWEDTELAPSAEMPHLVFMVDEVAELFKGATQAWRDRFHTGMTLGRAALVSFVLATQRPSAGVIPTDIRDATTVTLGFRTRDSTHTDMLFGDGKVPCHRIKEHERGVGYILAEGWAEPVRCRAPHIPKGHPGEPSQFVTEMRACAHLRVPFEHHAQDGDRSHPAPLPHVLAPAALAAKAKAAGVSSIEAVD